MLVFAGSCAGPQRPPSAATTHAADAVLVSEFIFDSAPYPSCHAATIAATRNGLVAAWFGGTHERAPDVGIWVARHDGTKWSTPIEVATGTDAAGKAVACWNPVLFVPRDGSGGGKLLLFYKVGPSPAKWWGMVTTSTDDGATWSPPQRLPDGILGPAKNKPIELADGSILAPASTEGNGWHVHVERSTDTGVTWSRLADLDARDNGGNIRMIQPTLLDRGGGSLQMLCRTPHKRIYQSRSSDNGVTWSPPTPTQLPNPNSGIDAVQLADGRSLLVYNDSTTNRTPLNVAISVDDGNTWKNVLTVEDIGSDGQVSYPSVIQSSDGLVHIVYTWKRKRIRHVVLDPRKLPS
jgi:predicted neuraminidase